MICLRIKVLSYSLYSWWLASYYKLIMYVVIHFTLYQKNPVTVINVHWEQPHIKLFNVNLQYKFPEVTHACTSECPSYAHHCTTSLLNAYYG